MNYKIVRRKKQYCVLEVGTNKIVRKYGHRSSASELCQHLNLGGGFDGYTPSFILSEEQIIPIDINEAFLEIINNS